MKKVLIASFMVALMLITVCSAMVTADAVIISKESSEEETSGKFTITVIAADYNFYYFYPALSGIRNVKITLKSEDGTIDMVGYTDWHAFCYFRNIPDDKNYIVTGYKKRWDYLYTRWETNDDAIVWMEKTGVNSRTLDNPFILERFPLLNLLLQRLSR